MLDCIIDARHLAACCINACRSAVNVRHEWRPRRTLAFTRWHPTACQSRCRSVTAVIQPLNALRRLAASRRTAAASSWR